MVRSIQFEQQTDSNPCLTERTVLADTCEFPLHSVKNCLPTVAVDVNPS